MLPLIKTHIRVTVNIVEMIILGNYNHFRILHIAIKKLNSQKVIKYPFAVFGSHNNDFLSQWAKSPKKQSIGVYFC